MKNTKFKIGQKVFHVTPDSEEGIITNIIYYYRSEKIVYEVAVGWGQEYYCNEFELSETKVF